MKFTFYEKIVLIILVALMSIGSLMLYSKGSRSFCKIEIIENGVKEELTLKEVEERLKERQKININTSSAREITTIDSIGEVLASRIVQYRDSYGPFYSETDLLKVEGIGKKKLEKIREYVEF